uniref:Flavin-containing monooxygenase n=1 Tax=Leersia perrieri TaxID=77586 RepID=A0A0D9XGC8_9ORYZ
MDHRKKRVAIVGAGTSGLAACKHLLARGFRPVVFDAGDSIGGQWTRTLASTRLQSPRAGYRFSDFPWPESVVAAGGDDDDCYPRHDQVVAYLAAYARRFAVDECVILRSTVLSAEFVGGDGDADEWELWNGNGDAFGDGSGVWRLTVRHDDGETSTTQVYEFDFLVLCIGRFSGVPNIPAFADGGGPEVFRGRVIHSMEFPDMDDADAAALVKGKRVVVVGSGKSAFDIAAESARWLLHGTNVWGKVNLGYIFMNRFAELMVRKPGAGYASNLLATLLAPLGWLISKLTEAYYKKEIPMEKHNMSPEHGLASSFSSCRIGMLPDRFYDMVNDGSIVIKRSPTPFTFCADGLMLAGGERAVTPADLVILATGFRGDEKLRRMLATSRRVRDAVVVASRLYRECVHPRVAQMAVVGYTESLTNIHSCEMMAKWVARLVDGAFRVPPVRRMEESVAEWHGNASCIGGVNIWYNDELCRDMGCEPRRKKGMIAEWFQPYGAADYADIQ